jgi:hypothetical protein
MSTQRCLGALDGIGGNGGGVEGDVCLSGGGAGGTLVGVCCVEGG